MYFDINVCKTLSYWFLLLFTGVCREFTIVLDQNPIYIERGKTGHTVDICRRRQLQWICALSTMLDNGSKWVKTKSKIKITKRGGLLWEKRFRKSAAESRSISHLCECAEIHQMVLKKIKKNQNLKK
jgi:hypothetical protein